MDDGQGAEWDAHAFVDWCLADDLEVVAVTDHNSVARIAEVIDAARDTRLSVIPGIEISTSNGHVVILAASPADLAELEAFASRVGAVENTDRDFKEVMQAWSNDDSAASGRPFRDTLLAIGAHADAEGSMLGPAQVRTPAEQVKLARQLDAVEVTSPQTRAQWQSLSGVKETGDSLNLIESSDAHFAGTHSGRATWMYLEELDARSFRQALATAESAVRFIPPNETVSKWIKSVAISGGAFDGLKLEFSPRCNAIIGPPSSGKSLILDCLRFVFNSECGVESVRLHSELRLRARLGEGATVTVVLSVDGEDQDAVRSWGGASSGSVPFTAVMFSQNELQARAMDKVPSMDLLDVHCPENDEFKRALREYQQQAIMEIGSLSEPSGEARVLSAEIENPVDGFSAIESELNALTGTEAEAKVANDISRAKAWRATAIDSAVTWRANVEIPEEPLISAIPQRDGNVDISSALPRDELVGAAEQFKSDVESAADHARDQIIDAIEASDGALVTITDDNPWIPPSDGISDPNKQAAKIEVLRSRINALNKRREELAKIKSTIDNHTQRAIELVRKVSEVRVLIRDARKEAATRINLSMQTFAARILLDADTHEITEGFRSLARGTNFRADRVADVWSSLDRERLIRRIAHHLAKPDVADGTDDSLDADDDLDAVVVAALERGRLSDLATACTVWAADQLDLIELGSSPPRPFTEQTEGMHALAIKEISFAKSDLPAISDQPEDAVPTQKVFEQMVPAIRQQRARRQFIFASHDANIVVAADVERVFVLDPTSPRDPTVGTLFDKEIRLAALDLLEGGKAAFERRTRHYARR